MSLRTWLIKLLGGQPEATTVTTSGPKAIIKPDISANMDTIKASDNSDGNTIFLSTDLGHLFLLTGGKLETYDLRTRGGLNLGLVKGALTVLNSIPAPGDGDPASPIDDTGDQVANGRRGRFIKKKGIVINLNENSQFTLTYNRPNKALGLIGAMDIIQTFDDDDTSESTTKKDPSASCSLHLFSLEGKRVNIQRLGDRLEVRTHG